MKIGIFTDTYNPTVSGVVTSINMLEKELKKRGHEVYIYAPSKSEKTNPSENLIMLKSVPLPIAKQYKNRIAGFYSREAAKEIKEVGLDIVHTQSEFGIGHFGKIISRKFDIPFIHTYHTMWEDYIHYIMPIKSGRKIYSKRLVRNFSKAFVRKAECVISPSKKTEKYLKYKCKVKNKPIYIIPTGIDISPFKSENFSNESRMILKEKLGIKPNDKVILFIGRMGEEKSIDIIMDNMPEIIKNMPNVKFLLIGDGPSRAPLEEQAKKLNILDNVIFTGKVPWADVPMYYNLGDVFVNASVTETQGLTFIEAMASGVPIVAKYAPNLTEFITHNKNGILVRKNSEFSKNILNVLNNTKLSDKLKENGLETAKMYSSEVFADKIEMLYKEIIKNYKLKKNLTDKKEKNKHMKNFYKTVKEKLLLLSKIK